MVNLSLLLKASTLLPSPIRPLLPLPILRAQYGANLEPLHLLTDPGQIIECEVALTIPVKHHKDLVYLTLCQVDTDLLQTCPELILPYHS